jgi:Zn-finger nucleic acid-binding protein
MKCPKCGADMREIERQGIKVDQCGSCGGIYFDRGELELLLDAREQKGFLGGLKTLFK